MHEAADLAAFLLLLVRSNNAFRFLVLMVVLVEMV